MDNKADVWKDHFFPFTLKLSKRNFESLFGNKDFAPKETNILKETDICKVLYNPDWHTRKVEPTPYDRMLNYFKSIFKIDSINEFEQFPKVVFAVRYNKKDIKRFLKWFNKFVYKRKIPLYKNNEYRMTFVNDTDIPNYKLEEMHCVHVADKLWAVVNG